MAISLFHKYEWNDYKSGGNFDMPKPENNGACLFTSTGGMTTKEGKFRDANARKTMVRMLIPQARWNGLQKGKFRACQSQKSNGYCLFHKHEWNDYKRGEISSMPNQKTIIIYSTSTVE
ncbi:hypothetical protein AVEN_185193-1 [Araneus ventricosus]|uniref:Uncharacterized protein n=1 Tax=Araneus ventricosus TaxID=182803 RepID=A0A4Y2P4I9_ARAVE|nr:hypothetical protein AVEN_185193-1 [Araneus ventricosus]